MRTAPFSMTRRELLRLAVLTPAALGLGMLPGCSTGPRFEGSFIQPWASHLALDQRAWQQHMDLAKRMGCREILVQWAALFGGTDPDFTVPDATMQLIFGTAAEADMQVRVGLPYHSGWWTALQTTDPATLDGFLALTLENARRYLQTAPWPKQDNFSGWYLPYELEQYHWGEPDRQQRLCDWLAALCSATQASSPITPAISTYFSRLPTTASLAQLWTRILDQVVLRPMVQDGVGVAGLGNLAGVDPLLALLKSRNVAFDLVIELFEELPSSAPDGSHFQAQTADAARIQTQLEWAQGTGAHSLFAFALDPWLSQDTPRAQALRQQWRAERR